MAFEVLSLGAAITANQITNVPLTHVSGPVLLPALSAVPPSVGVPILLDGEFTFVVSQTAAGVFTLRGRGSEGTAAVAHDVLTNVYASLTNDFGNPQPGTVVTIDPAEDLPIAIGQDGTIPQSGANSIYNINKASALAGVLAAPLVSDNGVALVFVSLTAFAHVIASSALFLDGTAGTPKSTITLAANRGATITLVAENGFWAVSANNNAVLS